MQLRWKNKIQYNNNNYKSFPYKNKITRSSSLYYSTKHSLTIIKVNVEKARRVGQTWNGIISNPNGTTFLSSPNVKSRELFGFVMYFSFPFFIVRAFLFKIYFLLLYFMFVKTKVRFIYKFHSYTINTLD